MRTRKRIIVPRAGRTEEQRDIFVFQCNVSCRVGDLMSYIKQSVQNSALEYIAAKTLHFSGRTVVVPLNSIALEIVEKYRDKAAFKVAGITRLVTEVDPFTRKEVKDPNLVASLTGHAEAPASSTATAKSTSG